MEKAFAKLKEYEEKHKLKPQENLKYIYKMYKKSFLELEGHRYTFINLKKRLKNIVYIS
jgi:hypothetical protein